MKSDLIENLDSLSPFILTFTDSKKEVLYKEKTDKCKVISHIFCLITLIFSIVNVIIKETILVDVNDPIEYSDTFFFMGLCFIATILKFLFHKNKKIYPIVLYSLYVIFFCNLIVFCQQLKSIWKINTILVEKLVFLKIDFLSFNVENILKFIWIFSPLNNFLFIFFSNILTLLIYLILFHLHDNIIKNEIFGVFFIGHITTTIIILICSYLLERNKKLLFESKYENSKIKFKDILDNINTGYIKFNEGKVIEINNFFEKEKSFFNGKNNIRVDFDKKINYSEEESKDIIFLIMSNFINFNENLNINEQLKNNPISKHKKISELREISNIEVSVSQVELEVLKNKIFERNTCEEIEKENSSLIEHILNNKEKFSEFTNLGKSRITKEKENFISYDTLVKVNQNDNSIEIIINDISKLDMNSNFLQFLIKTGQFLHDFKNPLICVHDEISELKEFNEKLINYLGQIVEEELEKGVECNANYLQEFVFLQEKYEYIRKMSDYCQNMIASYEDISRGLFDSREIQIKKKEFDLFDVIRFIYSMMTFKLGRSNKNVNFLLEIKDFDEEDILIVENDENKLKQVIINLLSNSEKFTPIGYIKLIINRETINDKKYIKLTIEDSGRGMSKEMIQKLFTPFFSNNSDDANRNGCGLGLLIVKEITEKLGIGIKVKSELGVGTSTWFYIEEQIPKNENIDRLNSNVHIVSLPDESKEIVFEDVIKTKRNEVLKLSDKEIDNVFNVVNVVKGNNILRNATKYSTKKTFHDHISKHSSDSNRTVHREDNKKINSQVYTEIGMMNIFNNYYPHSDVLAKKSSNSKFSNLSIVSQCNFEIKFSIWESAKKKFYSAHDFNLSCSKNDSKKLVSRTDNISNVQISVNTPTISLKSISQETKRANYKYLSDFTKNQVRSEISIDTSHDEAKFNILIVDNEYSIRSFAKKVFKKIQKTEKMIFVIEEADDGLSGLVSIFTKFTNTNECYDLIIVDDSMSLMDGTDMYKVISYIIENNLLKIDDLNNILDRFIICSSASDLVKSKLKNLKEVRTCEKPLSIEFVKKILKEYIN